MIKTTSETWPGRAVLLVSHVAGLADLVALPLWVGGLVQSHGFTSQQAGLLVTLYIAGILASNLILGPRFDRVDGRLVAGLGFAVAAGCFLAMAQLDGLLVFTPLHLLAGLGAGAGLSCVHGTIGRSRNPHRLFALVNVGVGAFGIPFFAVVPHLMTQSGVAAVFIVLGSLMLAASVLSAIAFPHKLESVTLAVVGEAERSPLDTRVMAFLGVVLLTSAQSAIFSFIERVGSYDGFPAASVATMLAIAAFINLSAPALAGLLQGRLSPTHVAACGMFLHGCASLIITHATLFAVYAIAASTPVFLVVFSHVFMFGLIAKLDRSGHMAALTPAMMMIGTAIGPFLGGSVVTCFGYPALGITAAMLAWGAAACFVGVHLRTSGVETRSADLSARLSA
ncbi:MFS transporter [Bradyrhizobium sp. SZCCHNS1054]|uniref:MFS transporter n=1 Tax=Bradyrhizobium sp. SZCCHNS1054 TaxID=3057301 RepID=UPI002916E9DA|nr:MFS transporter [Bradyrhizobium sp. SZCCHNS1054]